MDTPPQPPPKPDYDDVSVFGNSLRGILVTMLLTTCCAMWMLKYPVPDALLVFTGTAFGFYFNKPK